MRRINDSRWQVVLFTLGIVLLLGVACSPNSAPAAAAPTSPTEASAANPPASDPMDCAPAPGKAVVIDTAKLYVEYNATDEDLGVHGAFDDHGYAELCVYDPNGVQVLALKPQHQLQDLTMAGIFFESREPPVDEFNFDDIKKNFPEGQYEVRGTNFDGTGLTGAATFSHNIPAPPALVYPEMTDEESAGDVVVPIDGLMIQWEDVTETVDGKLVAITGYEVIITRVENDDPHGYSRPVYDVHVLPDRNSLAVPAEFLEPGTLYELEILALEESGNQTITVSFFTTEETAASSGETIEFAGALPKIEYNAMAGDLGFHVELDGDPFRQVTVLGPDGNPVFDFRAQGDVAAQGLTSFAFESAEPPLEELPRDEFLARFPEGDYTFTGTTIEGGALESVAEFSHNIPDPPPIISPAEGETVPQDEVIIAWEPVTSPDGIEIDVYLVQVFPVDPPEGQDPIDLNIDLLFEVPAFVTEVRIPPEFLTPGAEYQYEVTAIGGGGNQTLAGGTFFTAE